MVPIGVLPAGAQESGSMNMSVRRAPLGSRIGEVADGGAPQDGFLGRGAGVVHADRCVHLALEEVVVRRAGHDFEQAPRDDHPAIRVADVLVRREERPAVLPEPVEEDLQGAATLGIGEKQVRIDPVGVRQQMPDADPFGRCGRRQSELRQVRDDAFVEIDDAALDLLEDKGRGQNFRDGSKQESGVLAHRRPRDDVRHPMGHDGLIAVVVDAGEIARDLARLRNRRRPARECASATASSMPPMVKA